MRGANGAIPMARTIPPARITSQTSRGFTGHEELNSVGLVHMNGRVYDPLLARFGTADPMTESPFSTQGWNRYSYVGNSPLNFTDPSGYCFMGCFWKSAFRAIGNFFRQNWGAIVQIAAAAICSAVGGPGLGSACGAVASAIVTGITSGDLGKALRAGLISAVTAIAFYGIGDLTGNFEGSLPWLGGHGPLEFGSPAHLFNIAGHALVGCASAMAKGGKCGPGALSGAAGSFGGPLMEGLGFAPKLVATSVLGGLASVAGGGKFADGAVTAAFGYLFNYFGRNWHEFAHRSLICQSSQLGCTKPIVFDGLLQHAYPGQPEGSVIPDEGAGGIVIGNNPVFTTVDRENWSITNYTLEEHSFCCGYVKRTVVEIEGGIYVDTYGSGNNRNIFWAGLNWFAGHGGFIGPNEGIRRHVRSYGVPRGYGP